MSATVQRLPQRETKRSLFEDWAFARKFLLPAAELRGIPENDLIVKLAGGILHLWTAPHSAVLTQFEKDGNINTINVYMAGGNLKEIAAMESEVITFGKQNGCKRLTWRGREGWKKVALSRGYKLDYVSMCKDI